MSRAWQAQEREVAGWMNTNRNPLSGRNNVADDGSRRLGDVIHPRLVVEVKRHKSVSMVNVPCVRDLAEAHGKPWVLVEYKTGYPNAVKITVPKALAARMLAYISTLAHNNTI